MTRPYNRGSWIINAEGLANRYRLGRPSFGWYPYQWTQLKAELPVIEFIRIPRGLRHTQRRRLEGPCDASESAYAAYTQYRTIDEHVEIMSYLLLANTKVALTKGKIALPRLELNGAVLLAQHQRGCDAMLVWFHHCSNLGTKGPATWKTILQIGWSKFAMSTERNGAGSTPDLKITLQIVHL